MIVCQCNVWLGLSLDLLRKQAKRPGIDHVAGSKKALQAAQLGDSLQTVTLL